VNELVVRIAARGDGVTSSGRHVPFGVPGDAVLDDGALAFGPHHQQPPCRHFPECGGCQLQHADDEAYRAYLVSRLESALAQHGLAAEIREPHLSPPNSRRRASLKALRTGQGVLIGFSAAKSHRIVDMRECHVLRPELFALVQPLRALLSDLLSPKRGAEAQMTLVDRGVDLVLRNVSARELRQLEALIDFAGEHRLARLAIDAGADMVIGNHAHWAAAMETYRGRPIWYALGNFVFDQTWSELTMEGITLELTFSGSRLVQARMQPHLILDRAQPNLLDPADDGRVVLGQVFDASEGLLDW